MQKKWVNDSKSFTHSIRVYIEDTDAVGIVYYVNYLKFMERARTEYIRHMGIEHHILLDKGIGFVVADTSVKYLHPAYLDDTLSVSAKVVKIGRASLVFEQQVFRPQAEQVIVLCTGQIRIGVVNTSNFRPCALPEEYLELLRK